MEYYVYVTNDCNLMCSYCSVLLEQNNTKLPKNISYDISELRNFIDKCQMKNHDECANIYFFGGEPTLNYNTINDIISKFNHVTDYKVKFVLHTNGLLLDIIPSNILNKIDIIFLSLNYEKIFNRGHISDYFSQIIRSINKIKVTQPITVIGRLTISQDTDIYAECSMIGNFFDYVYWQLDNQKELPNMGVYKENYKREISLLFDYWISFLKNGVFLAYVPFLSIVQHYINEIPTPENFYCGYGKDIIYIQTDGSCYGCCDEVESSLHCIGSIFKGTSFKDMNLENTICVNCAYLKICGGRCGRMHKDFCIERIEHFCDINIFTFDLINRSMPLILEIINSHPRFLELINDPILEYTELVP